MRRSMKRCPRQRGFEMDVLIFGLFVGGFNLWWIKVQRRNLQAIYQVRVNWVLPAAFGIGALSIIGRRIWNLESSYPGANAPSAVALAPTMSSMVLGSALAAIDHQSLKLPLVLVRPFLWQVLIFGFFETGGSNWVTGLAGALIWGNLLLVGHVCFQAVGYGDVLFGFGLGFWLGLSGVMVSAAGLCLLSPLLLVGLLGRRGPGRARFAFGPYLFAAAALSWGMSVSAR